MFIFSTNRVAAEELPYWVPLEKVACGTEDRIRRVPFLSQPEVTIVISEVTKSQRNKRRQRRPQIFKKIYIQTLESEYKVVD